MFSYRELQELKGKIEAVEVAEADESIDGINKQIRKLSNRIEDFTDSIEESKMESKVQNSTKLYKVKVFKGPAF